MGEPQSSPTTPPTKNIPLPDTPAVRKCTQDPSYVDGDLEEGRVAVIQELGESIFEVSVQFFLNNILPPLHPEFDLDRVIQTLKDQNDILQSG
ncbi:hypothetical protein AcV7_007604 [Taiwanofungus camphoratus]|nr:hypothetical protein AcV7_007604 [Antrodia cinnamomea]